MAIFDWNGTEFVQRVAYNIKAGDLRNIKQIIDENADLIINRWSKYFNS